MWVALFVPGLLILLTMSLQRLESRMFDRDPDTSLTGTALTGAAPTGTAPTRTASPGLRRVIRA